MAVRCRMPLVRRDVLLASIRSLCRPREWASGNSMTVPCSAASFAIRGHGTSVSGRRARPLRDRRPRRHRPEPPRLHAKGSRLLQCLNAVLSTVGGLSDGLADSFGSIRLPSADHAPPPREEKRPMIPDIAARHHVCCSYDTLAAAFREAVGSIEEGFDQVAAVVMIERRYGALDQSMTLNPGPP